MAVHLKKLCVGVASLAELREWREKMAKRHGKDAPTIHKTRNTPKRAQEILEGGSLYWVIAGQIRCRQKIVEIRQLDGKDNGPKCALVMSPNIIETHLRAHRPFQGWRYFETEDTPPDVKIGESSTADLPQAMENELRTLGLL